MNRYSLLIFLLELYAYIVLKKSNIDQSISTILSQYPLTDSQFTKSLFSKGFLSNYKWSALTSHKFWPFWGYKNTSKYNQSLLDGHLLSALNLKHRNWTELSQGNSPYTGIIDPIGNLNIAGFPFSIEG